MAQTAQPQPKTAWVVDPVHSNVEFAVRHMVIATVKGRFAKFQIKAGFDETRPENTSVEGTIDAASVDTGEAKRDEHLRSPDFFDAANFPQISFKSRRVERRGGDEYRMVGDLTIRDTTREAPFDVTFAGIVKDPWGNQRAGFTATTTLNRKDFGLKWNMPLEAGGLLVSDTVKVSVEVELVKQK
ncbi:MAG: YceI family protein [Dehalococcoidia bacterium]|nr:YceI family protein [Dehalococcoidia bacterium]